MDTNHMDSVDGATNTEVSGCVLVVDDDRIARSLHRGILAKLFDVVTASSGAEALEVCRIKLPDLILLDADMPEMDGYETCRQLREWTNTPVIFATAHQSLEEHLKAYDAGATDLITKPVSSEILLRKVAIAIKHHESITKLAEEKNSLQKMAMDFLSSVGQSGTLLNFMRASVECQTHYALAERVVEATRELGLECGVLIRHDDGPTALTSSGDPSPLEFSILDHANTMGRVFQFRRRLVANYDRVSIIVSNMPDETESPEYVGRIRDNIVILAETTEALCDNVDMRLESMRRAEQLQVALSGAEDAINLLHEKYLGMLGDARLLLQELVDDVERSYAWLDTNQDQELAISNTMDKSVQRILTLLNEGGDFDQQFGLVLQALRGHGKQETVELF